MKDGDPFDVCSSKPEEGGEYCLHLGWRCSLFHAKWNWFLLKHVLPGSAQGWVQVCVSVCACVCVRPESRNLLSFACAAGALFFIFTKKENMLFMVE